MSFLDLFKWKVNNMQINNRSINGDAEMSDIKVHKDKFLIKIQPYSKAGLLREIYRCDHFSVYAFGEIVYIACPHIMLDDIPYGLYMTPPVLRKIVKTHRKIYPIIDEIFGDMELNKDLIFMLQEDRIQWWKTWLVDNQNVNKIDKDFEREIESQ